MVSTVAGHLNALRLVFILINFHNLLLPGNCLLFSFLFNVIFFGDMRHNL